MNDKELGFKPFLSIWWSWGWRTMLASMVFVLGLMLVVTGIAFASGTVLGKEVMDFIVIPITPEELG